MSNEDAMKDRLVQDMRSKMGDLVADKSDDEILEFAKEQSERMVDGFGVMIARFAAALQAAENWAGEVEGVADVEASMEAVETRLNEYADQVANEKFLEFINQFVLVAERCQSIVSDHLKE